MECILNIYRNDNLKLIYIIFWSLLEIKHRFSSFPGNSRQIFAEHTLINANMIEYYLEYYETFNFTTNCK